MGRAKVAELLKELSHYLEVQDATRGGFQQDVWLSAHVFGHYQMSCGPLDDSPLSQTFTWKKKYGTKKGREILIKLLIV